MPDINKPTDDVTIFDPTGVFNAIVDILGLHVVIDQAIISTLAETYVEQQYLNGNGYHVTTNAITISGSGEVPFLLIKNPNGSNKLVRFSKLFLTLSKGTSTGYSHFRIYRNPTITNVGTTLTINKALLTQTNNSVCNIYRSPTLTANGTLLQVITSVNGTILTKTDLELMITANENLLITAQPSATGLEHVISLSFIEV